MFGVYLCCVVLFIVGHYEKHDSKRVIGLRLIIILFLFSPFTNVFSEIQCTIFAKLSINDRKTITIIFCHEPHETKTASIYFQDKEKGRTSMSYPLFFLHARHSECPSMQGVTCLYEYFLLLLVAELFKLMKLREFFLLEKKTRKLTILDPLCGGWFVSFVAFENL